MTLNNNTKDPLTRWWWPGQWLHIVYGVWIDQLWYWQNVRPRLRDLQQGWKILSQGFLGAILASLFFSGIIGGMLSIVRVHVYLETLVQGAILGILVAVTMNAISMGVSVITRLRIRNRDVVYAIVSNTVIVVVVSVAAGIFQWNNNRNMPVIATVQAVGGLIMGLSLNVAECVSTGDAQSINSAVIFGLFAGAIAAGAVNGVKSVGDFIVSFALLAVEAIVSYSVGLCLGRYWATRQVPDAEMRKRLANPKLHS